MIDLDYPHTEEASKQSNANLQTMRPPKISDLPLNLGDAKNVHSQRQLSNIHSFSAADIGPDLRFNAAAAGDHSTN